MVRHLTGVCQKILVFLHFWPLSLAGKCRIAFGAAVIVVLALALSIPYIWMGQLTKKTSLDVARATSETLLRNHFQLGHTGKETLAELDNRGMVMNPDQRQIHWIRFTQGNYRQVEQLTEEHNRIIESLRTDDSREDVIFWNRNSGVLESHYIRIFRATDNCINCHNTQGSASAFGRNEPIGVAIMQRPAAEVGRIILMNQVWTIVAGLIGGVGAVVAFYMITQRVILRPIRQLRALANNVADGNLDIRSSIKTRDEYEKLANAFNHMLDSLQAIQKKLQQANRQLDDKIAELSQRNIELYKANKIKSEFLANISHEFRTPLNAILGFADIIREKPQVLENQKTKRYAENIIAGGKRLLNMVNDLLDLAKIEAGKMQLHMEDVQVPQLCKSLVASFSPLTKKKKIKVKLVLDDDIPNLLTDAGKIQQILYNFLSNAVKFTPQRGRIEMRVDMLEDKTLRLSVSDTGCGIADADKEKIFDKFRQTDGSITRQSAGTGLGLTISKDLAAMLAGSVGMDSRLGHGATFWLDIPVVTSETGNQSVK
ncbi:MAG TPA: ATP-binding protein [Sedimentisphaerales bacterium]|nr:ATP-binding protein [Sedimentisphaerales bacterium]